MDKQLEVILKKQQMHARIKHTPPAMLPQVCRGVHAQDVSPFAEQIVLNIEKAAQRNRASRFFKAGRTASRFLHHSVSAFMERFPFGAAAPEDTNYDGPFSPDEGMEPAPLDLACWDSPAIQAEQAIEAGKFKKAKRILDNAMAEKPDLWLSIPYAELYVAMGENDKAVSFLVDAIYDHFGVQNMLDMLAPGYLLYEALEEIPEERLMSTAKRRQRCLADCEKYMEKYETITCLIEQERFDQALALCEELKAAGTYDNYLYSEFYDCYVGLKKYDECKAYLRSLYGKKTDVLDYRYPDDDAIKLLLDRLEDL